MAQTQNLDEPRSFAKYQLTAHLAEGRMGNVFKAKSHGVEGFEKILTIKIIDDEYAAEPDFVDALIEEAKQAVSLSHANVAQVYDLGREEETDELYIATEYINGFDLGRALSIARSAGRDWPQDLSIFIVSEAAKGIDYAHQRKDFNFNNLNLVHRDICPNNLLISFDGEVKVTDFGVSRAIETLPPEREKNAARRFLYAAPEHARGEGCSHQSDIFSLGLLLYEMLTGRHPYRDGSGRVAERAREAAFPPLGDVIDIPQKLQRIVDSMLVPDPTGRAESAGAIYEELVGYLFGNNLRADNRALSLLMDELRQIEQEETGEIAPKEAGLDQISQADVENFYDQSSASLAPPIDQLREMREQHEREGQTEDPTRELDPSNLEEPSGPLPDLPGELEEHFEAARAGRGKAVLLSGQFGRGSHYLPDRISEVLEWRGNADVYAIQTTPDDVYRPFGVLADLIIEFLDETETTGTEAQWSAVERLEELGASSEAIQTLLGLWGLGDMPRLAYGRRRGALSDVLLGLLEEAPSEGPVVLVIDRVELADGLSVDVLRDVIAEISDLPVMIALATSAEDMMREAFDVGRPETLEAIRVSALEGAELGEIPDLSADAADALLALALAEQPLSDAGLAEILDIPVDAVADAAEELADANLVRTPAPNRVLAGVAEASVWIDKHFERPQIERTARRVARYFEVRTRRGEPDLTSPTLVRLYAKAGQRRQMLNLADNYRNWLEEHGWLDTALDFTGHCSDLLAKEPVGSPQARTAYLLSRADLALELSRLDEARSSLEPLRALSENTRNERVFIRGQILSGRMAMQQDDLKKARRRFRRAVDMARGLQEPELLAESLLAMAGWAERYGDPIAAQQHLEGAMNLASRWGTFRLDLDSRSQLLYRAVRVFVERGMRLRAERFADDLEQLAESTGLARIEARAKLARAEIEADSGNFEEALELLGTAQQETRTLGLTSLTIELTRRRAAVALEADRPQLVTTLADELVEVAQRHDDLYSEQRGRDLQMTGRALVGEGREEALGHLRRSLERARDRDVPRDIYRCHRHLARALESDSPDEAEQHRSAAADLARRMRASRAAAE